jgi:hypothetical protein
MICNSFVSLYWACSHYENTGLIKIPTTRDAKQRLHCFSARKNASGPSSLPAAVNIGGAVL